MRDDSLGEDLRRSRLKHFIVVTLKLRNIRADDISDDEPLIGGRIGFDSLDALTLVMGLEMEFGIVIRSREESAAALASVATLAGFISTHRPEGPVFSQVRPTMTVCA